MQEIVQAAAFALANISEVLALLSRCERKGKGDQSPSLTKLTDRLFPASAPRRTRYGSSGAAKVCAPEALAPATPQKEFISAVQETFKSNHYCGRLVMR
jgi:hypothetical protein